MRVPYRWAVTVDGRIMGCTYRTSAQAKAEAAVAREISPWSIIDVIGVLN